MDLKDFLKIFTTDKIIRIKLKGNISQDTDWTKDIVDNYWRYGGIKKKHEAVNLGGFANTKSFFIARTQGYISLRMTVTLSIVYNINPYYIIGEDKQNKVLTIGSLLHILKDNKYDSLIDYNLYNTSFYSNNANYPIENSSNSKQITYTKENYDMILKLPLSDILDIISDKVAEKVLNELNKRREI